MGFILTCNVDADERHSANEMILTEIILNRSHEDITLLNKVYTQRHGRELKVHIAAQSDISLSPDLKRSELFLIDISRPLC